MEDGENYLDHFLYAVIMPFATKALLAAEDHPQLAGAMALFLNWCVAMQRCSSAGERVWLLNVRVCWHRTSRGDRFLVSSEVSRHSGPTRPAAIGVATMLLRQEYFPDTAIARHYNAAHPKSKTSRKAKRKKSKVSNGSDEGRAHGTTRPDELIPPPVSKPKSSNPLPVSNHSFQGGEPVGAPVERESFEYLVRLLDNTDALPSGAFVNRATQVGGT